MREVGSEEMSPNSGSKRTRESSTNMATNGVAGGVFPANERHIDGKCILGHLNGKNSMDSRKNGFIHVSTTARDELVSNFELSNYLICAIFVY